MPPRRVLACLAACGALLAAAPGRAAAATVEQRFVASDGVSLQTTLTSEGQLKRRPVIVEFSPYGRGTGTIDAGPAFNYLLVQIRGTGDSDGRFDALGPRTQADVAETLRWACKQPWSNGRLGINGFSASAITIYNSMHLKLPCVKGAVLKSGTFELYRDLLYPGAINNLVPGAGVITLIGAPALIQGPSRLTRDPGSSLDVIAGLLAAGLSDLQHSSLDSWWHQRGFRGDANKLPVLMIDGFFDVESRGAFQAYERLSKNGAHLVVIGAHDGAPAGTDGGAEDARAWLEHYVAREKNGIEREPKVKLWMSDGDRENLLGGKFVRRKASDWPVPGTRWASLPLDPARSGSAHSLNDGSLGFSTPKSAVRQAYPSVPSLVTNTDPPNTAIVGGFGINALTNALPVLSDMTVAETLGLSYTTPRLKRDVLSAGPASLELELSSTAPRTGIWVVVSDVSPDGVAHPVASGRLNSAYPGVDRKKSLKDRRSGALVQPYARFDKPDPAAPGKSRLYRVELWPIGNRFRAGHRIRVHVVGASLASLPGAPAINTVTVGAGSGSRLLLPEMPGSDLRRALGGR